MKKTTQDKFVRNVPLDLWQKFEHEAINRRCALYELIITAMEEYAKTF